MTTNHRITATLLAATAVLATTVLSTTAAHATSTPKGVLTSARAALHDWSCEPIADEKFSCTGAAGAGFSVNLRSTQDLPKWQQEDPEQIAYVARRWFMTVQPNPELSAGDFAAVKHAIARGRA